MVYTEQELHSIVSYRVNKFYHVNDSDIHIKSSNAITKASYHFENGVSVDIEFPYIVNSENLEQFLVLFLSQITEAVNNSLRFLLVAPDVVPLTRESVLIENPNSWKGSFSSNKIIPVYFDVEKRKHPEKTNVVLIFTNRFSGEKIHGFFFDSSSGLLRANVSGTDGSINNDFKEVIGKTVKSLVLVESQSALSKVHVNPLYGYVRVPARSVAHNSLVYSEVTEQSDNRIVFTFVRLVYTDGVVSVVESDEYTAYIDPEGEVILNKWYVKVDWAHLFKDAMDFEKNPNNTDAYEYLPPDTEPLYEGEELFVTRSDKVYIRTSQDCWFPVAGGLDWISRHKSSIPVTLWTEAERYKLALQLQK